MKVMITGASGFIGSALIRDWKGPDLIGLDLADAPAAAERYRHIQCDLTDEALLEQIVGRHRPDVIIHLAARSSRRDNALPAQIVGENVQMTHAVLRAARTLSLSKQGLSVILAGSAAEYGDVGFDQTPPAEDRAPRPDDAYAVSKAISSMAALGYQTGHRLAVAVLRFANVYGPGQRDRIVPNLIGAALTTGKLELYGNGEPSRQYLFIDDACRAIRAMVGQTGPINIADPTEYTNRMVANIILTALQDAAPHHFQADIRSMIAARPELGGARRVAMDVNHATRRLKWYPTVSLHQGIRLTVHHALKEHGIEVRAA